MSQEHYKETEQTYEQGEVKGHKVIDSRVSTPSPHMEVFNMAVTIIMALVAVFVIGVMGIGAVSLMVHQFNQVESR